MSPRPLYESSFVVDTSRLADKRSFDTLIAVDACFVLADEQLHPQHLATDVVFPPGITPATLGVEGDIIRVLVPVEAIRFPKKSETVQMLQLKNVREPLVAAMNGGPKLIVIDQTL